MKKQELPSQIFVSGTDTGIGKTVVSAMLTAGLDASYWKPIQSGLDAETDTEFVKRVTGVDESRLLPEKFRLYEPLSPHASAAIDGVHIDMSDFDIPDYTTDRLVVEGAGGLMVPMNEKDMIIDLIKHLDLPVLLVARSSLGTLNHTFLSLEALRRRNIPVVGVIMNGMKNESNRKAIEYYGDVEVIAELEELTELNVDQLLSQFNTFFKS
ncbi:MAG: dethiobiotin synthase [Balneolaceae bacterium]|nr:dethiobiotin synthase [Balneolaceae bacterium]